MKLNIIIAISLAISSAFTVKASTTEEDDCNKRYPPRKSNGAPQALCLPFSDLNLSPKDYVVPESDRKLIVETHNNYRRNASNPTAANMEAMVYDDKLARMAQAWAEQCVAGFDKYTFSYDYGVWIGQLTAFGPSNWESAIFSWWNGAHRFTYGRILGLRIRGYSQVMQDSAAKIGCGYADCATKYKSHYVCNYITGINSVTKPYKSGSKCSDCPDFCKNGLCDCGGKVCFNGGTKDLSTCECECADGYHGDQCLQEWCPGLVCENHATMNTEDCSCHCYGLVYTGLRCNIKKCPDSDAGMCLLHSGQFCKNNRYLEHHCPYYCGICSEDERPTCEDGDNCHKSPQGCLYYGKHATEEMCTSYGINGKDSRSCTNFGSSSYTCKDCVNEKTYCPYMCGYCKSPCGDLECNNGGYLDIDSCTCDCGPLFAGKSCEQKVCPYIESFKCIEKTKSDCEKSLSLLYECPYLCGICKESERTPCKDDPRCYKSRQACYNFGKPASPEQCASLGSNGEDHWRCDVNKVGYFRCSDCSTSDYIKTELCPYMCGHCRERCNIDCGYGGTLDTRTCQCICPEYATGATCDQEKCEGLECQHGDTDYQTCTCKCHPMYHGQLCERESCSIKDSDRCETEWYDGDCNTNYEMRKNCPSLCRVCLGQMVKPCEEDPNCYVSKRGCYYYGQPATQEWCKNNKDRETCYNNDVQCYWCNGNPEMKYMCPYMCGYCRE